MPIINALDASRHTCPFANFQPCRGSQCMAWSWSGSAYERCETDNLIECEGSIKPVGSPLTPVGEGWAPDGVPFNTGYHQSAKLNLPPGKAQRWIRQFPRAMGSCGRVGVHDDMPF